MLSPYIDAFDFFRCSRLFTGGGDALLQEGLNFKPSPDIIHIKTLQLTLKKIESDVMSLNYDITTSIFGF